MAASFQYNMARNVVFWNMVDFPVSDDDVDSNDIFENFTSSLFRKGYWGDLSIWAYAEEENNTGGNCKLPPIIFSQGEISALTNKMIRHILLWVMNTARDPEPSNLFVIAKHISQESELISVLRFLKSKNFNLVLVTQPDQVQADDLHGIVSSVWPSSSLLDFDG